MKKRLRVMGMGEGVGANDHHEHYPIASSPPPQSALDQLVGPDDIARAWHCSRRLIERLRAQRKFPPPDCWLGRLPRWKVVTLNGWLAQHGSEGQS
jgi:hypothetical protein